jgi:predicted ATP-grasp superfamily ATP-dependent carboligase
LLAKSPNSAGLILVAAVSGRALAQASRRAGYRVRVADFFGDDDTVAAAEKVMRLPGSLREGADAERLVGVLKELAEGDSTVTVDAVAAARHPGCRSEAKAIRDPFREGTDYPEAFNPSLRNAGEVAEWIPDAHFLASLENPFRDDAHRGSFQHGNVDALILGSGFERMPELIDELARHFPLAGNRGDAIRRVKDPERLAADCAEFGIPHPEFSWIEPANPDNWISKHVGGAGGVHVRPCADTARTILPPPLPLPKAPARAGVGVKLKGGSPYRVRRDGRYFQRRIDGQNISALFIADRKKAHLVGFSRQWTSPTPDAPFRYGGAVRLRRFDRGDAAMIEGWLSGLTQRAGLVGLCSADFIRNRDGYHLIEINPRPGATLDIFDSIEAPLIEAHIQACRGEPFELPRFDDSKASLVAYIKSPLAAFPEIDWPDWTADRQVSGSRLEQGDPVCTIFADGRNAAQAKHAAYTNLRQLEGAWSDGQR